MPILGILGKLSYQGHLVDEQSEIKVIHLALELVSDVLNSLHQNTRNLKKKVEVVNIIKERILNKPRCSIVNTHKTWNLQ